MVFFTDQIAYLGYSVLSVRAILPHIDTVPYLNPGDPRTLIPGVDPYQADFAANHPGPVYPTNPYLSSFADITVVKVEENCNLIRSLSSNPINDITMRYGDYRSILSEFIVDPSQCPLDFTCTNTGGPAGSGNFCNFITPGGPNTVIEITEIDPTIYPPGIYPIRICAAAGELTTCEDFTITVPDPCVEATLSLARQILPSLTTYTLGDPEKNLNWSS